MHDAAMQHSAHRGKHHDTDFHRHGGGDRHHHHPSGRGSGHDTGHPHHARDDRHERGRFGGRARRGEARFILLDALRDGPKHGYEIIKALEERSSGQYAPSPGTVYPTMQYLEDLGLVRADQEAERRVYRLTDVGQAELEVRTEDIKAFWARFTSPGASVQPEVGFLREELEGLSRTVWGGLREALDQDDPEPIRAIRQVIERCQENIREIIARGMAKEEAL